MNLLHIIPGASSWGEELNLAGQPLSPASLPGVGCWELWVCVCTPSKLLSGHGEPRCPSSVTEGADPASSVHTTAGVWSVGPEGVQDDQLTKGHQIQCASFMSLSALRHGRGSAHSTSQISTFCSRAACARKPPPAEASGE